MSDTHRLWAIIDAIQTEHGGRISATDATQALKLHYPDDYDLAAFGGMVDRVRKVMIRPETVTGGARLPRSVSDGNGTYVQRTLLDPDGYEVAIKRYMGQAGASRRRAYALAAECERIHGVVIDPITLHRSDAA